MMRALVLLGVGTAFTIIAAAGTVPARAPASVSAACDRLQAQAAALRKQITEAGSRPHDYGGPGQSLKPPRNGQAADLDRLTRRLEALQPGLKKCERTPSPPAHAKVHDAPGIAWPDPQIAVGSQYVGLVDTSTINFITKTGGAARGPISATSIFRSLFPKVQAYIGYGACPKNVWTSGSSDSAGANYNARFDPKHPDAHVPGCIAEAYDTRIVYDTQRHRFWIESAVRNDLWTCDGGDGGAQISGFLQRSNGDSFDPTPSNPKQSKCHSGWQRNGASWARRFIAVAVTGVTASGEPDLNPAKFHRYILIDDYADWPLLAVHGDYVILTHQAHGDAVKVFDANALARGDHDGSVMTIKPIETFFGNAFGVSSALYPANVHGTSGPAYLVGTNDNVLYIYGITRGASGKTILLPARGVHYPHTFGGFSHPPVIRGSTAYMGTYECAVKDAHKNCVRYDARVLTVPFVVQNRTVEQVTNAAAFHDLRLSDTAGGVSYALPAVDATSAGDAVVTYLRGNLTPAKRQPFGVEYRVLYHGTNSFTKAVAAKSGSGSATDPANLDLTGIAVDPSDDRTVWFTKAYTSGSAWTPVYGSVKP